MNLVEFEDEFSRRGAFELVYPVAKHSLQFLRCMRSPLYSNLLLLQWQNRQAKSYADGIRLLKKYCADGAHIARGKERKDDEDRDEKEEQNKGMKGEMKEEEEKEE